jgi:hypothetical protein
VKYQWSAKIGADDQRDLRIVSKHETKYYSSTRKEGKESLAERLPHLDSLEMLSRKTGDSPTILPPLLLQGQS